MQLTGQQKRAFRELGYTVLRGAIPQVMIDDALRAINHSLGYEGMAKDDLPRLRAQSYCNEVQKTSPITDLMNRSPVLPMVESLLGEGNLQEVGAGQIALRFPIEPSSDPGPPRGHLDGLGSGLNGSAKGSYNRGFTALAVILLSEQTDDWSGNFTVWPRSHAFFESYFKEHGHEVLEADGVHEGDVGAVAHRAPRVVACGRRSSGRSSRRSSRRSWRRHGCRCGCRYRGAESESRLVPA